MLIGEIAAQAGVSVQTIRFYERRGLLRRARRLASSYRDYPAETAEIIKYIKKKQQHGFSLKEIQELLEMLSTGSPKALNPKAGIEKKIKALDEQILALQSLRDELSSCLGGCQCRDGESPCPGLVRVAGVLGQSPAVTPKLASLTMDKRLREYL